LIYVKGGFQRLAPAVQWILLKTPCLSSGVRDGGRSTGYDCAQEARVMLMPQENFIVDSGPLPVRAAAAGLSRRGPEDPMHATQPGT